MHRLVLATAVALSVGIAAPAQAAEPPLTVAAGDMTYGQPDLDGVRRAESTITYTNTTDEVIQFPVLTFPGNGRDDAEHALWNGCPAMRAQPGLFTCVGDPIGPGETVTLTEPWLTDSRGPGGTAQVRIEQGADRDGAVLPGTASSASWRVSFAKLTGTFDIAATDLTYGPVEADGLRRGSTTVTITNLTPTAIDYPLVTFPRSAGDAEHTAWSDCPVVHGHPDSIVCVAAPLAPQASRQLTFPFIADGPGQEFDANVRVDAGADPDGTVIAGTAAGTRYTVSYAG